jgi:hypothetical protein
MALIDTSLLSHAIAIDRIRAMKIISFAVFGKDSKYSQGMLANIEAAREIFDDWNVVIYCDDLNHQILQQHAGEHVQVVLRAQHSSSMEGMFWRFEAATMPGATAVIFRDSDSILTRREKIIVDEWLASRFDVHIIRDHPMHTVPILGGMFGVRNSAARMLGRLLAERGDQQGTAYFGDQIFLGRKFYPLIKYQALVHTSFVRFLFEYAAPIPDGAASDLFVGAYAQASPQEQASATLLRAQTAPRTLMLHCWQGVKLARSLSKRLPIAGIRYHCRWCL